MAGSLVHKAEIQGNAAHALVIGVGDYPHLAGGSGELFPDHENMGQLGGAPISARRFADWLIGPEGYHDPNRPLASVRLLLSGGDGTYPNPATGESHAVPPATLAEVTAAIGEWVKALDANEGDLAFFFFSGHGVMVGMEQILLLSDFGNPAALKVRGSAIRFNPFRAAMSRYAAREQCYFLDACRSYTDTFASALGAAGESFIDPAPKIFSRFVAQPVFNASVEGESAFGRDNEPSLFTEALLQALKGGGTDNRHPPYDWRIEARMLDDAVAWIMERRAEREGLKGLAIPSAQESRAITLGKIRGLPLVPVALRCNPGDATSLGRFSIPEAAQWRQGEPDPLVRYGTHRFEVTFEDPRFKPASFDLEIRPPYRTVELPVEQSPP
jgi:hypothetical protein